MSLFDQAKSIPITDVIAAFHAPVSGNTMPCPFHPGDRSPSFTIYEKTDSWCCFGCQKGGDGINFVANLHGISNKDAALLICQRFNIIPENYTSKNNISKSNNKAENIRYERALQRWADQSYVKLCELRRQHDLICSYEIADSIWHARLLYIDYLLDLLQFGTVKEKLEILRSSQQNKLGLAGVWINGGCA